MNEQRRLGQAGGNAPDIRRWEAASLRPTVRRDAGEAYAIGHIAVKDVPLRLQAGDVVLLSYDAG